MSNQSEILKKHIRGMKKYHRRKSLNQVNKKLKRSRAEKKPRRKHWSTEAAEELDVTQTERMMPLGEGERRRMVEKMAFQKPDGTSTLSDDDEAVPLGEEGLILSMGYGLCEVETEAGVVTCRVRSHLYDQQTGYTNPVAVGDKVIVTLTDRNEGLIEAVLPRQSVLARPDSSYDHLQRIIVANVDQLLIVASWRNPTLWLELIDRYLIAAERDNLTPIICINKIDLVEDTLAYQTVVRTYRHLNYGIVVTSAKTGQGISQLRTLLHQQTTVVAGLSGVGKSSLLTAIQPDFQLKTGQVSGSSGEGQHTTTQATLHRLRDGGAVVDTPGIRSFALAGLEQRELAHFFPEMQALAGGCRFKNCQHLNEPRCAVQAAVNRGAIAQSRYHSYQKIRESLLA